MATGNEWATTASGKPSSEYMPKQSAKIDPAPTPEEITTERLQSILKSATTGGLEHLADLRDEIDNLIRTIKERNDKLASAIVEHVGFIRSAIECKNIVKENLLKIGNEFKNGTTVTVKTE